MAALAKLADLDYDAAIAEISAGALLKNIAARYGVAKQSLHERLSKHPEWATAVALQAETLVETATDEAMSLDSASTMPDIARARVKVDTAHKWAAARDPARWAPGQRMMGADGGPLQVEIVRYSAPVTIDATPVKPALPNK